MPKPKRGRALTWRNSSSDEGHQFVHSLSSCSHSGVSYAYVPHALAHIWWPILRMPHRIQAQWRMEHTSNTDTRSDLDKDGKRRLRRNATEMDDEHLRATTNCRRAFNHTAHMSFAAILTRPYGAGWFSPGQFRQKRRKRCANKDSCVDDVWILLFLSVYQMWMGNNSFVAIISYIHYTSFMLKTNLFPSV